MATGRPNIQSRLRRLLSNQNNIGPSIKVNSETPPEIEAFIDKVIQSPLQDIAIPLYGFKWEYGKGNFHHWRPLFLHFDAYFTTYLSSRSDLLLSDNIVEDDSPFPKNAVLQILRVMQIILENCPNRSSFSGLEHFKLLLSSTDPEILIATLETLSALVKIRTSKLHGSEKLIKCGSINSCLLSLSQGWGSKDEGLGLFSCATAIERTQDKGLCLFPSGTESANDNSQFRWKSTLYFELHKVNSPQITETTRSENLASSSIINIPDLHLRKEDDLLLMKECIERYNVPSELRFSLLTRIRYAHSSRSPRICRMYTRICLLAFVVLVQSSDAHEELTSFFGNEPEYTNELIRLVRSEPAVPCIIKTDAMLALGAHLAAYSSSRERARVLSVSNISTGNRTILLNVLQRAASSLNNSNDSSSIAFVEAILQFFLIHVISSSNSGTVTRGSGIVSTFLPLLEDSNPAHLSLVCIAVKTLQKLMDYSHTAVTLFIDSGGQELLATRLQIEVHRVIGLDGGDHTQVAVGECSSHNDDQFYSQRRFIKNLLKALGSVTYAPANSTRSPISSDNSLLATLSLVFGNASKFGGDIYSSAVTLMNEIIHKDPTCFTILHECGLPDAFLSSVSSGVLPSSKALICVPHGLGALCLNVKGLEVVKSTSALQFLVDIFTSKKYVVAMNEGIVPLTNAVEELLRHVPSLRSSGVDIVLEIIKRITFIADENHVESSEKDNGGIAMEMDSEDKGSRSSFVPGHTDSAAEEISNEQFVQLCIFHVMVLVHKVTENTEICRIFVEKSGIEALLKLLLRSSIAESSEGMSIALHSTMVFKGFTQLHSAPLARALCFSLREHLKKALLGFGTFSGSCLLDPKTTPNGVVFSSLFIIDFILLLTASKDTRCASALLTEFGNGNKDVLEDIGRVHREVLWQVSLLEDDNSEAEDDNSHHRAESQQTVLDTNETEEPRVTSLRELMDPLLRRRTSGSNVESQFSELLNLYRDLNRTTGLRQRLGTGNLSNSRFGVANQLHQSGSSEATGALSIKDDDKHRSYYSSCRYTLRALAVHITHLFHELGKAMLLPVPSRRREHILTVSPSSISVVSSIASIAHDHMNFGGHVNPSISEAAVSTKCRYLGKVIEFFDNFLLEKPDSCNPIVINYFSGRGVFQSVLTTFQATCELMFTINSRENDDASLKPEDKAETDLSWIYGPLASYGKLMEHLVTSSLILSRPTTKHLLVQPVTNGVIPFPRDGETFVKVLQSIVLKAVIPVWNHPQFTKCDYKFISTLISINRHIYSGLEVKKVPNPSTSVTGPPNETSISAIVEMGFSRSRAEEALRQVGLHSVELAMEWLFTHQDEPHEDDELARALAISLGQPVSEAKDEVETESNCHVEEETVQLPPVEDLLSTCTRLLQMKESLAFPVRDLLVMLCSQNDGQYRPTIVTYIIDQVKQCSSTSSSMDTAMLSALFHVIALILHEDTVAREIAFDNGLVKIASELLSQWDCSYKWEKPQVPNWVKTAFLAIDRLLHVDQKLDFEIIERLKKVDATGIQISIAIDEDKQSKLQCTLGLSPKFIDMLEQKKLIEIACSCIKKQLPSETTQAVLQLCATLTRTHAVALNFSDAGGLPSLLSLPASSLFSGFDNIAATIIRHILEDPQTLQQAMESEIRHSIVTAGQSRLTPNQFVRNLTPVISRDPVIFIEAAQSVCQVEMTGEVPHITLLKDKTKEKERHSEKSLAADEKAIVGSSSLSRGGHSKVHRKPPQSFVNVIEFLLDSVVTFVPPSRSGSIKTLVHDTQSLTDMDVDPATIISKGKAKATSPKENEAIDVETSLSLAKTVFILKFLKEILLMYGSAIYILLRRDSEISSCRGVPQRVPTGYYVGGIFHHVLDKFLPCSQTSKKDKKVDGDWSHKLASKSSQFLVASCVRSSEARRRVFTGIRYVFSDFLDSSIGFMPPRGDILASVSLLNEVLSSRSPAGSCISTEASALFVDVGLVKSLTGVLEVLDLDHTDSSKVVTTLVKVLDLVTKEHVHSVESNTGKSDNSAKPEDHEQSGRINNLGDTIHSMEIASQPNQDSLAADNIVSYSTVQTYGSSEAVPDDVHHDQDIDGGFAPITEGDYMQESSDDTRDPENGIDTLRVQFEIQPRAQEDLVDEDDDEEMSGDDGDEVDEEEDDDEENNDIERDEVNLPHADIDGDDHEIDEDEEDEEMLDEEDEGEDGVMLRLDESIGGINVFDHIEVLARDGTFPDATLRAMPVEVFGSRRQGRTTSIYSFLGRAGDSASPSQHPLLVGPSSSHHPASMGQTGNARDLLVSDQIMESTPSRLDSIFRSLRNGHHGHRFTLWGDVSQQTSGSNASAVSQIEELLLSRLRRPVPERPSDQVTVGEPQIGGDITQMEGSEAGNKEEAPAFNSLNEERGGLTSPSSEGMVAGGDTGIRPVASVSLQEIEGSQTRSQFVEMQFENNDTTVQDVEVVNLGNSESGAALGENLLFVDGDDDDEERPGPAEVLSLGDILPADQARGTNATLGISLTTSGGNVSLHSVSAVAENPTQEADQGGSAEEPQINGDVDSRTIDSAFLDALPEDLRAEVLSAQQGQVSQPSTAEPQTTPDIDPEFLAALPPDIRAEVLAQQETQRRHQSRESEGRPVEMDTESIIATFPSDIREEVLLTSSDAILSSLTPALVAEANMLRERFANRYNHTLFGIPPRNHRGGTVRHGEGIRSSLDRATKITWRRSVGSKLLEADGEPLVDAEALRAMLRLLRVVQPLYRGHWQRLLLNLCAYSETRMDLVRIMMGMLTLDPKKSMNQIESSKPQYHLYACQSNVMYSRPQFYDGIPPLVSRRILETLTYLAQNHPSVAKILLQFRLPQSQSQTVENLDRARGKAVMVLEQSVIGQNQHQEGYSSIVLLMRILSQPLYVRSTAHLEQLLNLLDVIIDNAEQSSGPQISGSGAEASTESKEISSATGIVSSNTDQSCVPTTSSVELECDTYSLLVNLPQAELRILSSLLAREGLSDNVYTLVAEILRKLVAFVPSHCHLFIIELGDAVQDLTKSAIQELHLFGESDKKTLLGITSCDGPSILRVLLALTTLVASITEKRKDKQSFPEAEHVACLAQISSINAALEPLWNELSTCITRVESYSEPTTDLSTASSHTKSTLPAGTQNILPYIESFFIACEKLHVGQSTTSASTVVADVEVVKASGSVTRVDENKNVAFEKFSERHKKLLNAFIRQNPGLLEKSFSLMLKVPRLIDFDNKRAHFRSEIKHKHDHHRHNTLRISVRRAYILEDSYNQLRMRSAQDLRGRLTIQFHGEEGIDAGGLSREWYQLLSRFIFDKGTLLFTTVGNDSTFQPNPNSVYQAEHLSYFKFVGRVVGKALLDGQLLDMHFTRSFYKHILGVKVSYHDIEAIDPDYFKNLKWMLENDISDVLDLTFSIDADEEKRILYEKTEVTDYELIPGGRNIKVTEENKHKYVDLVAENRLTTAIRPQINAFLEGFNELISRDLISIFNDKELELLISGLPDIDLDDMRLNTEYSGYSAASPVIQWFWEVVQGFSKEDKARLLQFITGTSKVPLEGFSALQGISGSQKFQIHKAYGSSDHLPSAHTCFNQLDLPEYPSKQHLEERLLLAIHEANEGFGFI